ncbi:MAG: hypothetical protein IJG40_03580 [Oscillospiraceae bacterium]|nr:hypothetical protein [Oscillospiraceae bacterium]
MKKQKTYFVSRRNWLTLLAVFLLLASAAALPFQHIKAGNFPDHTTITILSAGAVLLLSAIVLFHGEEFFFRTAIPVWLWCLLECLSVFPYSSVWQKSGFLLLYVCIAILYTALTSGKLGKKYGIGGILVCAALLVILRGVPAVYQMLPTLLMLAGLILLTLSMKEHKDGLYHQMWGDRPDGRRVRSLSAVTDVGIYFMPNRNGAHTMFADTLDITEVERYIHAKRRSDIPHLSMVQIFLTAYCRTMAEYPALNRFISGQKIYTRDGDIVFNMTVKKKMTVEAEETIIKIHFKPDETLYTVSEKLEAAFQEGKAEDDSNFDRTASLIKAIPGLLKKFTIWLLKVLDYFGLIPLFLLDVSPFHGSVFFTSMASLGIPPVYHHLYDFGNLPVFLCMGDKYKTVTQQSDGTTETRKKMKFTVVSDERICDGFYYSRGFKAFKKYLLHPELLEQPPKTIRHDIP